MASTLKVDNIVGTSGSTAPITLSGDTATLGSGVTIASGVVTPASIGVSLVYLESTSGTAVSEIKFENKFTDTSYLQYILEFHFKPTIDDRHIVGQFGYGGSSTTWITGSYRTSIDETHYNGTTSGGSNRSDSTYAFYTTGVGADADEPGVNGTFYLIQPYVTGRFKMHHYHAVKYEQNDYLINQSAGTTWVGGTSAITAMKFFAYDYSGNNHGNITGELRMYALKGS
jgi:hypothetical protein